MISLFREKKVIFAVSLAALGCLVLLLGYFWVVERNLEPFFPSMEEAFANHPDGSDDFGEILFVHEYEGTLMVLHRADPAQHALPLFSFFLREEWRGRSFYFCIYTGMGGLTSNPLHLAYDSDVATWQWLIADFAYLDDGMSYRMLGRVPLYGFAFADDERVIHSLELNGQPVDYVVPLDLDEWGGSLFFWYFLDAQVLHTEDLHARDVIISFEE